MTSIFNLNNNLTKAKEEINKYKKYKENKKRNDFTVGLNQGEKFKNYQNKIIQKIIPTINYVNSKEGFQTGTSLINETNTVMNNNKVTTQEQQQAETLRQQYKNTLSQYKEVVNDLNGASANFVNRVDPNNPYLNKLVSFNSGELSYITNQGVAKYIPSTTILNSLTNSISSQNPLSLNVPWDNSYANSGATIPTTPQLISGTPVQQGQSLGNEGENVFVNQIISNPNPSYQGCFQDNQSSPLMTFIGGSPMPPVANLQNTDFSQPQIPNNSFQYLTNTAIPGWIMNCVLVNSSSQWGFPTPYPYGDQCACIQQTQTMQTSTTFQLTGNVSYNVSFTACGRNCCDGSNESNPVNIVITQITGSTTTNTTITTVIPTINTWQEYSYGFTPSASGNYTLSFVGTWTSSDRSCAFQNIQLNLTNSQAGTYTYESCMQSAIDYGYQYFALQSVNPSTSTGFCAVSNSEPTATKLGTSNVPNNQTPLWSSNTQGNQGNIATLTNTGSLSIINSNQQSIFSTPNSAAQPSNYLGCYMDKETRAMTLTNNGKQKYDLEQCEEIAQDGKYSYFGLQDSTNGKKAQCTVSNDFSQASQYGLAGNCTLLSDGTYSGGGFSNAIYNNSSASSNYYLYLQDDGNLCIYRGTGPNDNQGFIWGTMTNGKQQDANPAYVAANGKYGQNWIASGSTLAPGDFVGSTSGNLALIMQTDGNLVLYTFQNVLNCQKMSDGNTGGGQNANALYNIGEVGIPTNLGQLAYVDQNSELYPYPATNKQFTNSYTTFTNMDSEGNDIPNTSYANATVENCQTTCNNNSECAGFAFNIVNNICFPKTSEMYPIGERQISSSTNLYMRNSTPKTLPIGVLETTENIDTTTYKNYLNGGNIGSEYGLSQATITQQNKLSTLQMIMNSLSDQLNSLTSKFENGNQKVNTQSETNTSGLKQYLQDLKQTNNTIKTLYPNNRNNRNNTNIENILQNSDIVVLQKNYDYIYWSILAIGIVIISILIIRNKRQ